MGFFSKKVDLSLIEDIASPELFAIIKKDEDFNEQQGLFGDWSKWVKKALKETKREKLQALADSQHNHRASRVIAILKINDETYTAALLTGGSAWDTLMPDICELLTEGLKNADLKQKVYDYRRQIEQARSAPPPEKATMCPKCGAQNTYGEQRIASFLQDVENKRILHRNCMQCGYKWREG